MAKDNPWFKFDVAEWLTGDIIFESFSAQGLFINICAIYWQRSGSITIADIKKRYKNPVELESLQDRFFITGDDGNIHIKFLDEYLDERGITSKVKASSGSLGGKAKAKKSAAGKIKNGFIPPTLEDVRLYFKENGFNEVLAVKAFKYYSDAGWIDSQRNEIKNWKQKMQAVWFKEENKKVSSKEKVDSEGLRKNAKGQIVFKIGKIVS